MTKCSSTLLNPYSVSCKYMGFIISTRSQFVNVDGISVKHTNLIQSLQHEQFLEHFSICFRCASNEIGKCQAISLYKCCQCGNNAFLCFQKRERRILEIQCFEKNRFYASLSEEFLVRRPCSCVLSGWSFQLVTSHTHSLRYF